MRLLGRRRAPDFRTIDLERILRGQFSIGLNRNAPLGCRDLLFTREASIEVQLKDPSKNTDLGDTFASIFQEDLHVDSRRLCRDVARGKVRSPLSDVNTVDLRERHIPVKSASRIPACRLDRIVQSNGQLIFSIKTEVKCEIQTKRAVGTRPTPDQLAVEPNHGV